MKYRLINKNSMEPFAQVLYNRGISPANFVEYANPTDACLIHYSKLDNIESAATVLVTTLQKRKKIYIQVDSDCDGYTSSAALLNYIYRVFPTADIDYGLHPGKEHGIILSSRDFSKYDLVIIPDAGSAQYEEHKALKEMGASVIVIDHHEADRYSDDAIVVNNQLSVGYSNKNLCGVAMVYKFCQCLDDKLGVKHADSMLDLVALGLVADMMSLAEVETRYLIMRGLVNIQNPLVAGLVDKQSYSIDGAVTPIGVAFYIAPLINATIRMGTEIQKDRLFNALLETGAYEFVPSTKRGEKGKLEAVLTQAVRDTGNVRNKQNKERDLGIEKIEQVIQETGADSHKVLLIEAPEGLEKKITGLMANQIMAKYQKPILLLREGDNGLCEGSARGYEKSALKDFKGFLTKTGLFDYTEGHANAFGAGLKKSNFESFLKVADEKLADMDFSPEYRVDFIVGEKDKKEAYDIAKTLGGMKSYWGKDVDESLMVLENIIIRPRDISLMSPDRKPTLKIKVGQMDVIKFKSSKEEYDGLIKDCGAGYIIATVLGTGSLNEWGGNITPQLYVRDFEITGKVPYEF